MMEEKSELYLNGELNVEEVLSVPYIQINQKFGTDMSLLGALKIHNQAMLSKYGYKNVKEKKVNLGACGYNTEYVLK